MNNKTPQAVRFAIGIIFEIVWVPAHTFISPEKKASFFEKQYTQ